MVEKRRILLRTFPLRCRTSIPRNEIKYGIPLSSKQDECFVRGIKYLRTLEKSSPILFIYCSTPILKMRTVYNKKFGRTAGKLRGWILFVWVPCFFQSLIVFHNVLAKMAESASWWKKNEMSPVVIFNDKSRFIYDRKTCLYSQNIRQGLGLPLGHPPFSHS